MVQTPCPTCAGAGVQRRTRTIQVKVPAGVKDGARIRLAGKGEPGGAGGTPGDLFVRVHVQPHRLFGRSGDDLTVELPVTFPEAALGANVEVPTLNGPVTLKVPAGHAERQDLPDPRQGRPEEEGGARRPPGDGRGRRAREAHAGAEEARGAVARGDAGVAPRSDGSAVMTTERNDERGTTPVHDEERAVYIISVAAELAGVHPQTLRIYERKGLLAPKRTSGNTRRYSERDIQLLRQIQDLTQESGVNLAGVKVIIELQAQLDALRDTDRRAAGAAARAPGRGRSRRTERQDRAPAQRVPPALAGEATAMTLVLRAGAVTLRPFTPAEFDLVWAEETRDRGAFEAPWAADDERARERVSARIEHSGSWRHERVLDLAVEVDGELAGDVQARRDLDYAPPGIFDLGIGLFRRSPGPGDRHHGARPDHRVPVRRGARRTGSSSAPTSTTSPCGAPRRRPGSRWRA